MGHDAFVGGYRKPNFKLHLIIFITIVGVSVFLSTQVEKSKTNTRVEALKIPVPVDSMFIDSETTRAVAKLKEASKPAPQLSATESEVEYQFDDGSRLTEINKMLEANDPEEVLAEEQQVTITLAKVETTKEIPVKTKQPAIPEKVAAIEKEKDIAIMVPDDKPAVPVKKEPNKPVAARPKQKQNLNALGNMDSVYELQQDRFLETLAKSAELETKESVDIKRIKEAIRADKPLTLESSVNSKPETRQKEGLVKVATTDVSGVINTKPDTPTALVKSTDKKLQKKLEKKDLIAKASVSSKTMKNEPQDITLTKSELNNVVKQFAQSYNKGDINRLIALFDNNAQTNDQKNKQGIKAEYTELFKTTADRNIQFKNMFWDLGKGKANGSAKFVVYVKPVGSNESALVEGKIKITAIKGARGVFIKSFLHELASQ